MNKNFSKIKIIIGLLFILTSQIKANEAKPDTAFVGVHIMNIYDLEMPTNSFYIDFYLWVKWKGELNPVEHIYFTNLVEVGSFVKEPLYETVQNLNDGNKYMLFRIEGRFFNPFSVQNFPIDKQILSVLIENEEYQMNQLIYLADDNQSGLHDNVIIPGWEIKKLTINSIQNEYKTSFGITDNQYEKYSELNVSLIISRPLNYFIWKLLLPLIVVLISSVSFIYFPINDFSSRFYLPIYAILTAVFLQLSYASAIPETGYMVLMDKIYVATYLIFLLNMIQIVVFSRLYLLNSYTQEILEKWDKSLVYLSVFAYVLYGGMLIYSALV